MIRALIVAAALLMAFAATAEAQRPTVPATEVAPGSPHVPGTSDYAPLPDGVRPPGGPRSSDPEIPAPRPRTERPTADGPTPIPSPTGPLAGPSSLPEASSDPTLPETAPPAPMRPPKPSP